MSLTYKIVYSPNNDDGLSTLLRDINFVCSDNKIHIRLRDYDHEEVIHGFINKLTYLVTYLFQRNAIEGELTNNIIEKFVKKDSELDKLITYISVAFFNNEKSFLGLKITKNYRKIKKEIPTPLGSFLPGTCPLVDGISYGGLEFFSHSLHFNDLYDFLFNDAVEVVITKDTVKESYTKFTNKSKKVKKEILEYVPLF